ncbi:MAG: sigma-70 family RNA polymerase sigma factor [Peptostreptococcaceae bacterium]
MVKLCEQDREQLILENMYLVKYIASKYYTQKLGMEYEDLVSYGVMGLIDAANKFDDSRGCKFSTYATLKIKSFIIDEIRRFSPISRNDVARINQYNSTVDTLQKTLLREPTEKEISDQMNVSLKDIKKIENSIHVMTTTSLDSVIFEGNNDISLIDTIKEDERLSPSHIIEEQEKVEILAKAIDLLNEKDRLVLSLYYYEELTLKEIGKILEVSESRVSQLHSRAIVNLRGKMSKLNYNIA